jgi:hypothetical protein
MPVYIRKTLWYYRVSCVLSLMTTILSLNALAVVVWYQQRSVAIVIIMRRVTTYDALPCSSTVEG